MAYDDKTLVRDGSGLSPAPQYFNPDEDAYEPLFGRNNAARAELYDENGDPINITGLLDGVSTALNTLTDMIEDIVGDAVASILAKIIAAPATEAKQTALTELIGEVQASPTENTLLARIKALETKIDAITDGTTPAVTQLSGSNVVDSDSLPTHLTTLISGEDQTNDVMKVEQQFSYKNLAAVAETVVKATPGLLHLVTINTYGNTDCTLIIYDNTSAAGTKIATIDVVTANNPIRLYDVMFTTGLTVAIAGTGTICDITISYR